MEYYKITENDQGQRLDKFVFKLAPALPKSVLYKAIRKKDVLLNGTRTNGAVILKLGDTVGLYLHSKFFSEADDSFLKATPELNILYEDSSILVVNKPAGLLLHASSPDDYDTLVHRLHRVLYERGEFSPEDEQGFSPAFINRIDRNTSGIVVAAKSFPALQGLNEKMRKGEIVRKYLCLVRGVPEPREALLEGYHRKDPETNKSVITQQPTAGSVAVATTYRLLEQRSNATSLLEVELLTGRSHQIRAHMASIGHPLVGDYKYGGGRPSKGEHMRNLVAYYIRFNFSDTTDHLAYLSGKEVRIPITEAGL